MAIRITPVTVVVLAAAAVFSAGCDGEPARAAKARAALQEAMASYREAARLYKPGDTEQDLATYRRGKLAEAASKLEPVAGLGDSVAAAEALRLLAEINVEQASDEIAQADVAIAGVGRISRSLFDQLKALERIEALILARGGDGASVLQALTEGEAFVSQSKAGVTAAFESVGGDREGAILDAEKHNNTASAQFTRAAEFEQQAFVASNDTAKQEAYTKAYQAQLAGQAAQKRARDAQIRADSLGQQAETLRNEIALWDRMARQLGGLSDRVRQEGESAARDVSAASSNKVLAVAALQESYDEITAAYDNQVRDRLVRAEELAKQALGHLDKSEQAAGGVGSDLAFARLRSQAVLAKALSRHARYAHDFAGVLDAVAKDPAVSGTAAAQACRGKADELAASAQEAGKQAADAVADGVKTAEPITNDSAQGKAVASLTDSLKAYQTQLP